VAAQNISIGEEVFSYTLESVMTEKSAMKGRIQALLEANPTLPNAIVLALHLLEEKYNEEQSNWFPFISSLPEQLDSLIYITDVRTIMNSIDTIR